MIKIAIIGAGSQFFTCKIVTDLLNVPSLLSSQIVLMDTEEASLKQNYLILQELIDQKNLPTGLSYTTHLYSAVQEANYIFNFIKVGGLKAQNLDITIPLKYGVAQCVGDTLCAGGIFYGQRQIPSIIQLCKAIKKVAHPNALLLNYSNPLAMTTWVANLYGINTLGLCHGVQYTTKQIAKVLELPHQELVITAAGINHLCWFLSIQHKGIEKRDQLLQSYKNHPKYSQTEKVRINLLETFGYYPTESNGHCSEYFAWYRKTPRDIEQWSDNRLWLYGQTAGYLYYCRNFKVDPANYDLKERSFEYGSYIIEALETGQSYRGHFNVVNQGYISNLPNDAVVELPVSIKNKHIEAEGVGNLPNGCASLCQLSINVQRLSVEASLEKDRAKLKQALLLDPLVGAVCNPSQVTEMMNEMLVAQQEWLGTYQ